MKICLHGFFYRAYGCAFSIFSILLRWQVAVVLLLSVPIKASEVAPPGYSWHSCQVIECHFLVPDSWQFKPLKHDGILKLKLAPSVNNQAIPPSIRINILTDVKERTGLSPERNIALFMAELDAAAEVIDTWNHTAGAFRSTAASSLQRTNLATVKTFNLLISNSTTGTLYVFTFETLASAWKQDWPVVEQIFTQLRLDDGV